MGKKRPDLDDIFKRTEEGAPAEDLEDLETGRTISTGYGDKEGIIAGLDAIARERGVSRNELLRFAVRRFLLDYRAGRVTLEVREEVRRKLKLP